MLGFSQDCNLQEKMDFEMRMRAGAYKLLVASTKREQILDAAKSLLTCNTRIQAYMTEAQRRKELQDVPGSLKRRSDMVCWYITVAGECAILNKNGMLWGNCEDFTEMFVSYRTSESQNRTPCKGKVAITGKRLENLFSQSLIP